MIRILIFLMAFNTILTPVSLASVCAPDRGQNALLLEQLEHQPVDKLNDVVDVGNDNNIHMQAQIHCDNCTTMGMDDMANMNCDAGCGVSCLASPLAMTSNPILIPSGYGFSKPVSAGFNFYTRSLSPELQPPLV
jgi:hypothetical protein